MKHTASFLVVLLAAPLDASVATPRPDADLALAAGCERATRSGPTSTFRGCGEAALLDLGAASPERVGALLARFAGLESNASERSGVELFSVRRGIGTTHLRFRQRFDGLPVFGGELSIHLGRDGRARTIHSLWHRAPGAVLSRTPKVDAGAATELALFAWHRSGRESGELGARPAAEIGWFPVGGGELRLAWRVEISTVAPLAAFRVTVDALDGEPLEVVDRLVRATGSGLVFSPNPVQNQGSTTGIDDNNDTTSAALDALRSSVQLLGLDGTGFLRGEFADLTPTQTDAFEATLTFSYNRADDRFEQVVAYHAVDSMQRYLHVLGFDDDGPGKNGIRDYPTDLKSASTISDSSFYNPGEDTIHFGTGGVDDAEDVDIIAHEYGHAIQNAQAPGWGGGEMGAMGEGFGDYWAASSFAEAGNATYQESHAACVAEWDATAYDVNDPPCLRRVDGNKHYPEDLVDQAHADGEIWSRALWDLRGDVGRTVADTLVLQHHFSVPAEATMPQAALELLDADQELNAGAHELAIRTAFCDRGILFDACPLLVDGFEDGFGPWQVVGG